MLTIVFAALVLLISAPPPTAASGAEPVPPPKAPSAPAPAPGPSAFTSARPYLVALSVADVKASVAWYSEKLGFRIDRAPYNPVPGIGIAFLEKNGFHLEIIQSDGSAPRGPALPKRDNDVSLRGIVKLAFVVEDVDAAAASLRAQGVAFLMAPTNDPDFGVRFLMIRDPDENVIQIFQLLPRSA
jgi:catechol 2,3-dioxygenase-like lactoylglutathione lyase family enzyme